MATEPIAAAPQHVTDPNDPHPHWSEPAHDLPRRFDVPWIATTWLIGFVGAVVLATIALVVVNVFADPFENGRSGVATIVAGLATFIAFVAALRSRLTKVDRDRLLNSLAVPALHLVVVGVVFLVGLAISGASSTDLVSWVPGGVKEEAGVIFVSLERSSVAAILAGLLIPGILPARGGVPSETQTGTRGQDRQL